MLFIPKNKVNFVYVILKNGIKSTLMFLIKRVGTETLPDGENKETPKLRDCCGCTGIENHIHMQSMIATFN